MIRAIQRFLNREAVHPYWIWFRRLAVVGLIVVWANWSWTAYWLVYNYAPIEPALPRCHWRTYDTFDREEKMSPEFLAAYARHLSSAVELTGKYRSIRITDSAIFVPRRFTTEWWGDSDQREYATKKAVKEIWESLPEEKRGINPIDSKWAEEKFGNDTCAPYLPYITGKLPPKYAKNERGHWEAVLE